MTRPRTLSGFIASRVFAGDPLLGEIWWPGKASPKAVEDRDGGGAMSIGRED